MSSRFWLVVLALVLFVIKVLRGDSANETIVCGESSGCFITCYEAYECQNSIIYAPIDEYAYSNNKRLTIMCMGDSSCQSLTIYSSIKTDVICQGQNACQSARFFFGDIFEELQFVLPDASLDDADLWTNPYITSPAFTVQTFFNGVYSMSPTAALLNTDVICKGDATCSVVAFSMYFISNLNLYCLEGDSDENSCGVTCADGSSCLNVTVFCDTPIPLIPSNGTYCEAVGGNLDGNNVDIQYFNVSNAVTTEISEPLATTTGIVDTSTTMRYYENVGDSVAVSDVPQYGLGHIIAALGGVVTSLICCVGLCIFTVRRVRMKRKLDLHTVTNTDMDQVVMNAIDTSEASHGVERGPGTSVTIGSVVIPNGGSSPQLEERALIADIEGKGAQSVSIVSREASACFMNNGGYTEYAEGMQTGHGTIR